MRRPVQPAASYRGASGRGWRGCHLSSLSPSPSPYLPCRRQVCIIITTAKGFCWWARHAPCRGVTPPPETTRASRVAAVAPHVDQADENVRVHVHGERPRAATRLLEFEYTKRAQVSQQDHSGDLESVCINRLCIEVGWMKDSRAGGGGRGGSWAKHGGGLCKGPGG